VVVGIYLDPGTGRFYGRVPEIEDGALYHAASLREARELLREALNALPDAEDQRLWTRYIRVHYPAHAPEHAPGWRRPQDAPSNFPWEAPGWWDRPSSGTGRSAVGPLRITRIERALRPDKGSDVREWEEDYKVRLARWEAREVPSVHPAKPQRHVGTEPWPPHEVIELPWSPETWEALQDVQARIRELDERVRAFFQDARGEELIARLLATRGRAITAVDSPTKPG
jgi:hypothetical protein